MIKLLQDNCNRNQFGSVLATQIKLISLYLFITLSSGVCVCVSSAAIHMQRSTITIHQSNRYSVPTINKKKVLQKKYSESKILSRKNCGRKNKYFKNFRILNSVSVKLELKNKNLCSIDVKILSVTTRALSTCSEVRERI